MQGIFVEYGITLDDDVTDVKKWFWKYYQIKTSNLTQL